MQQLHDSMSPLTLKCMSWNTTNHCLIFQQTISLTATLVQVQLSIRPSFWQDTFASEIFTLNVQTYDYCFAVQNQKNNHPTLYAAGEV